jgi:hypothetical protein
VTFDRRIAGRIADLRSHDLRSVHRARRWADSYMVGIRSVGPVVTQRSGYNIELLRGEPAYERERRRVYAAQTQRVRVELPATCEPRFEPDTPAKAEMKAAVTSSLSTAIATWGRRPARGGARMTIADFNPDYPETFAYRQDTGEVLRIRLPAGDPSGRYVVAPVPPGIAAAQLRRLIQKYGETRLVTVR